MNVIYKYGLTTDLGCTIEIEVSENAKPLDVQMQKGIPNLWVKTSPADKQIKKRVHVIGTGWGVPTNSEYIATVQDGPFVWHIFWKDSVLPE